MIGTLSIDETDFKEQIQKTYDTWKQRQKSRVVKLRKAEKQRLLSNASSSTTPIAAPASTASSLGQEPTVNPDGTVPVMIDSIKAGDVTEITLEKIQYWRWNGYEQIGGTDYYTGVVGYQTETIFGEINTEGKALIRGGKVAKWIYSGSEEEIK